MKYTLLCCRLAGPVGSGEAPGGISTQFLSFLPFSQSVGCAMKATQLHLPSRKLCSLPQPTDSSLGCVPCEWTTNGSTGLFGNQWNNGLVYPGSTQAWPWPLITSSASTCVFWTHAPQHPLMLLFQLALVITARGWPASQPCLEGDLDKGWLKISNLLCFCLLPLCSWVYLSYLFSVLYVPRARTLNRLFQKQGKK